MKKLIIILSIVLFSISYIIVCILGQEKTLKYSLQNTHDIKVECDKRIITCKRKKDNNNIIVNIKSVKPGKTNLKIVDSYLENNKEKENIHKITVYVHPFGVITTGNYLGKCNGDISFLFSFYIIMILIIINLIRNYIKKEKDNLYSYKNVKSLGLIIFLVFQYLYSLLFFIYDYIAGYNQSIENFISSIKENITIFIILTFPIVMLITILVILSNIKLMIREGKSFKNMLGIALGGMICLISVGNTLFYVITPHNNIIFQFLVYLIYLYVTYLECILVATCILGFKAARRIPKLDKDYMIILGCKIRDDGTLPPLIRNRVDKAIEFSKLQKEKVNKDLVFIPSGGKGLDEVISEADAMKNYLIEQGISKQNIIVENKSTNTYENIKYSYKIIKEKSKNPNIAFSTTNYHVFRAGVIATNQNIKIEGIGAPTKPYYWINSFIREFVATLVSEKKSHIRVLISLIIILLINMLIVYLIRII